MKIKPINPSAKKTPWYLMTKIVKKRGRLAQMNKQLRRRTDTEFVSLIKSIDNAEAGQ